MTLKTFTQRAAATAGVVAATALGGALAFAPSAAAASAPADVTLMSCPGNEPAPQPGFRCLSWYPDAVACADGVAAHVAATPAVEGYCASSADGWWGYVNIY